MDFGTILCKIRPLDWAEVVWLADDGQEEERMVYEGGSLIDGSGLNQDENVRFREIVDYSLSYDNGWPVLTLWWEKKGDYEDSRGEWNEIYC